MKRAKIPMVNGMVLNFDPADITGFGVLLNDGSYLTVEIAGGPSWPVAREDRDKLLKIAYSDGPV